MRRGAGLDGTVARGMRTPKGERERGRGETGTDMKPRVKDEGAWSGGGGCKARLGGTGGRVALGEERGPDRWYGGASRKERAIFFFTLGQ